MGIIVVGFTHFLIFFNSKLEQKFLGEGNSRLFK